MGKPFNYLFIVLGTMAAGITQAGPLGQSTTPIGAAFASASAGSQVFSSLGAAGNAIYGGVTDTYVNSQYNTSSVGGTATASASNAGISNGHPFSNFASIHFQINNFHLTQIKTLILKAFNGRSWKFNI